MNYTDSNKLKRAIDDAVRGSQRTDSGHWEIARAANKIVGKYQKGATRDMAEAIGATAGMVEDHAHAWWMYVDFLNMGKAHRIWTYQARKMPFIHYSHFRVLYDLRQKYNLTLEDTWDYFWSVVMAEGTISVRALEFMVDEKHGDEVEWSWYCSKALKYLQPAFNDPKLPDDGREVIKKAIQWIGDRA